MALSENLKATLSRNVTVSDMLTLIGIVSTASYSVYRGRKDFINWHSRYCPNSVRVELSTIKPIYRNNKLKYQLSYRSVYDKQLRDIISNEYGITKIQKAAKKCTENDPFIKLKRVQDQWYFYGSVIAALEQNYGLLWFMKGYHTNVSSNTYHPVKYGNDNDDDLSNKYVLAMVSTMKFKDVDKANVYAYLKWLYNGRQYGLNNFKIGRKIRGILLNEEMVANIVENEEIDFEEWENYLDLHGVRMGSKSYYDLTLRWHTIGQMIDIYKNGNEEWANPLCWIEIPDPSAFQNIFLKQHHAI